RRDRCESVECGTGLMAYAVGSDFDNPEKHKGKRGSSNVELGAAGNLGFGFPTEELRGQEKRKTRPGGKRGDFGIADGRRRGSQDGLLEAIHQVSCRKE